MGTESTKSMGNTGGAYRAKLIVEGVGELENSRIRSKGRFRQRKEVKKEGWTAELTWIPKRMRKENSQGLGTDYTQWASLVEAWRGRDSTPLYFG